MNDEKEPIASPLIQIPSFDQFELILQNLSARGSSSTAHSFYSLSGEQDTVRLQTSPGREINYFLSHGLLQK